MHYEPMSVDEGLKPPSFEVVYVRSVESEPKLSVKLLYDDPISGVRQFNFLRDKAEAWEKFSQRIVNNIRSGPGKKKKKNKKPPKKGAKMEDDDEAMDEDVMQTRISIVSSSNDPIDSSLCTDEALVPDHLLCIGDVKYSIKRNSPTISNLRLSSPILLNCPIIADIDIEFCDLTDSQVEWFISTPSDSPPNPTSEAWTFISKGLKVIFSDMKDVGKWVKVKAVPCDSAGDVCGLEQVFISKTPIECGPTLSTPIRRRHEITKHRVGARAFRVVSYNVLADYYADSDHSRDYLYPYCPPSFIEYEYRRQVIAWELMGYNADIICLQEVDEKLYNKYLKPVLDCDFDSQLLLKRQCAEGVAMFYRRDKFGLAEDCSLSSLSDALFDMVDDPEMAPIVENAKKNEKFTGRWGNLRQGLLSLVLRCLETDAIEPQLLIVASCHLYFHPNADHMRLLQGAICLKHLARIKQKLVRPCGSIFAGDFNSDPRNIIYEMATVGKLRTTAADWYSCGKDEYVGSPELNFNILLSSAYNVKEIEVTNYTAGYRNILDYIYFDTDAVKLSQTISLPSTEEICEKIALPNEHFPSDHVALVSDFLLK